MSGWNFADVFEAVSHEVPDAPAIVQGSRRTSWADLDRRASALSAYLVKRGLQRQDKVAQYMPNRIEYLESFVGVLKGSFVPINVNFRYGPDELTYILDNSDARAVVFWGAYSDILASMLDRVVGVDVWLWIDAGTGPCPTWAVSYEDVVSADATGLQLPWTRDGDDLVILYTGGTTGAPKGVMWRQDDLFVQIGNASQGRYGDEPDIAYAMTRIARPGRKHLPAVPLMHGAGLFTCLPILSRGGSIVLLEKLSFDPVELLDTLERERVDTLMWVGDAFAKPVLAALDAEPERWDLSSLVSIVSSGVIFSAENKKGILRHIPNVAIVDVFGSSETTTMGTSISSKDGVSTATFRAKPDTRIILPEGGDVVPGSGQIGLLAFGGRQPLGYFKDPEKTKATFRTIDGKRYSVPGDWATIDSEGLVTLLGRGSTCINTGGEKVFPEEVEEVIKLHPKVHDAVVVGEPNERFGETVAAVVEFTAGESVTSEELISFVKTRLAGYKAPKRIIVVDSIGRGPSGKADLAEMRRLVLSNSMKL